MEGELALLADKEQPVVGTVLPAGVAAARTGLTGVVGIHADTTTPRQGRLVGQQSPQLGKRPAGGMPIRPARFGGNRDQLLALAAPRAAPAALADVREVF